MPVCGVYNCYGLAWANRRTAIYDADQIELIRRDDGYRTLADGQVPHCGDLVVYMSPVGSHAIFHVGVVSEIRTILNRETGIGQQDPWILSKWGDAASEVLHYVTDVPFEDGSYKFVYWTERP